AERLGLGRSVTFTGELTEEAYQRHLDEASVAVQLRQYSNGEMSAAVADCMAAGLPTIVSAVGGFVELPPESAVLLGPSATPRERGEVRVALLESPERRAALGAHARRHADRNSSGAVAATLWSQLLRRSPADGPAGSLAPPAERVGATHQSG